MLEHGGAGNLGMLAGKMDLEFEGFGFGIFETAMGGVQENLVHFWLWGYAVIWVGDGSTSAGGFAFIFGDKVVERDRDCSE
ncbi:hypothetical protein OSB04_029362 [Centaurea solstitialis]|uniref:Uncharacterized protein n=1 Tax=Centaurea solstitialis TaxID=347529 RepID=A0AA38WC25_9ASTR|nr:hypothetical protein OSB04_029362 [Centaurea solstitialis]